MRAVPVSGRLLMLDGEPQTACAVLRLSKLRCSDAAAVEKAFCSTGRVCDRRRLARDGRPRTGALDGSGLEGEGGSMSRYPATTA